MTQAKRFEAVPGLIVAICFAVAALEGYDIQAFGVAAPQLVVRLGLTPSQMGMAGSAAMVGLVFGALAGGHLADRWGRRPVLALATAGFGLFSVLTALAGQFETLTVCRFLTGLGFGAAMPNLIAIATEISPANRRVATTTQMFCGMPTGGALVALLAQLAGPALDWRIIFLIGGALPLALTPLILWVLPETRPPSVDPARTQATGQILGQGRLGPSLLLWIVFLLNLLITYLLLNWLPTLIVAKGFAAREGASSALWFNGGGMIGALVLGRIVDRFGFRWPSALAFVVLGHALLGLSKATDLPSLLVCSGLSGMCVLGGLYILYALAPTYYPAAFRAAGTGLAMAVGRLGSIAGPVIAGQLRAGGYSADQVFLAMVPASLAGAAAVWGLITWFRPSADS